MNAMRPEHAVTIEAKVGFQHCDPLGVVWHGRYFEWLEAARDSLFESRDLGIPRIRALGHRLYVVDARIRFMVPLTYGDSARITAWFSAISPTIRVAYGVHDVKTGRWCARAHTVLATTDEQGVLLATTPPRILELLPRVVESDPEP